MTWVPLKICWRDCTRLFQLLRFALLLRYNPARMDTRFDSQKYEKTIYKLWSDSGYFNPDTKKNQKLETINKKQNTSSKSQNKNDNWKLEVENSTQKPFCVVMPPPNANDPLHIGHAMFVTLEDIMIRYHRMLGDDTLWLPGTDHAGIETQFVFEKKLKKQGQSRFDFDRATLYQKIWDYVQENSGVALEQMKRLGASADWSRTKFTLDKDIQAQVLDTFKKLYDDGLVYRDLRLVSYCPHCGTAFSELEVEHQDKVSPLFYVRYPLADKTFDPDDPESYIIIATTRIEPIFADTHIVIHPDNPKTKQLLGKKVLNPLTKKEMEIIADSFVDPKFGTGIVKLTPAHDFADFEVAEKHHLPIIEAINTQGKITEAGGKYAGMSVFSAKKAVQADLEAANLIEKIDEQYQNRVAVCYRCKRMLEPLPLPQFFVRVNDKKKSLVKPVLQQIQDKRVKIHGTGYDKILTHWLKNLKDWNISRQIVWGIRLPVWYDLENVKNRTLQLTYIKKNGEKVTMSAEGCLEAGELDEARAGLQQLQAPITAEFVISETSPGDLYLQETDTFDTWFSSGQWPVLTLKTTGDFERFYPTQVMETAYDILVFWVMRMLLLGNYLTGKSPFQDVYLHGLVRDQKGQKMSKSKGNVINPLEIVDKYGADALRMALVIRSTAGLDRSVGEADFKAMRNFSNKLWNASRYIAGLSETRPGPLGENAKNDQAILDKIATISQEVSKHLADLKIGLAADILYDSFWHWFCDECIEQNKQGKISQTTLVRGLATFLRLLHPFVPFVTESVWQELRQSYPDDFTEALLLTAAWPK